MFPGADYIFAVQSKDYKFWQVVNNKVVINAQPYFLDYAPAGREDMTAQNVRNKKYWCIDRSVSNTLTFVNDGAQILKYIMLNKGMEETAYLAILEQQLHYEPFPTAVLVYTSGQSPFTPNTTTTGTITGKPGDTVQVKMFLNLPDPPDDYIDGNFDGFTFVHDGLSTSTPITFVAERIYTLTIPVGGVINFSLVFHQGSNSPSTASMQLLNSNGASVFGYKYWYKLRNRAEFDFTTFDHAGTAVKVSTLEESFAKFLKANEQTLLELPMNVPEAINIKMDGIKLIEKGNYIDVPGVIFSPVTLGGGADRGLTSTIFLNAEGDHTEVSLESQTLASYATTFPDTVSSKNCLFNNFSNNPIVLEISGTTEFDCVSQNGAWGLRRRFLLTSSDNATQNAYQYYTTGGGMTVGQTYSGIYTQTITVPAGERLFTQSIFFGGVSGNPGIEFTDNSRFSISFISRGHTTYIKGFRGQYIFDKFIQFVGEGNYTADTAAFFETHKDKVFTCGNAIRGFDDAVMKWSFEGFFQFWDCFSSVGLSEEDGVIYFDEKVNLTDNTLIIDLPVPVDFHYNLDRDMLYNVFNIGYPPIKNDVGVLNGNEEFNTGFQFSMGMMKKPAELDKVSKINASCYAIEKIRVTTANKDTTDYKADNDVFPVVINNTLIPSGPGFPDHYELDRSLNASATGLIEKDTVFNMALSPHLNFKRNGPWLRSLLWLCDQKTLKYQSADKNNKLEFDDPLYGHIIEKADENLGGLGTKFVTPIIFYLTIPAPDDILEVNPRAIFRFPLLGTTYKAISIKVTTGMASRRAQTWELLALPDNDFKRLENYYG